MNYRPVAVERRPNRWRVYSGAVVLGWVTRLPDGLYVAERNPVSEAPAPDFSTLGAAVDHLAS